MNMMPQNPTMMQNQPSAQAPAAAPNVATPMQSGAGAPPAPGAAGPQPVQNIGFNQDVQNILWSRVETLTEQEIDALDKIITPQTFPALVKLFPEIKLLFEQASAMAQQDMMGPSMPRQPAAQPAGGGQQNPIVTDTGASRGLMG